MLDIKLIRSDAHAVEAKLKTKDPSIDIKPILTLDERVRHIKTSVEELKAKRNHLSKEIGDKKRLKEDTTTLMNEVAGLGDQIGKLDQERIELEEKLHHLLSCLPNLPQDDIKVALDPKENVCVKMVGEKRVFDFPFKNHVELNEKLHLFDFKRSAKVAGSGWVAYRDLGARLEWALLNYMIDTHLENGFQMWMPPHVVRPPIMYGSGQLPKFEAAL